MKKLILSTILFVTSICISAQDFYISFQPVLAVNHIDSVLVTNQKTSQQVKIAENEPLLLTKPLTGTEALLPFTAETGYLYPNPCQGAADFFHSTAQSGKIMLGIYSASGQLVIRENHDLPPGLHRFRVTFPVAGIYFISATGNGNAVRFKAVCTGNAPQKGSIAYSGSEGEYGAETNNRLKSKVSAKTMTYSNGDILLCSAFSGKNNTIIADSPTATKVYATDFFECKDLDSRNYPIVKIGNQWWMARNLAQLPSVSPASAGSETVPFSYVYGYDGTSISAARSTPNYSAYGVLYNWPAIMNGATSNSAIPGAVRGICPAGWHIPSDGEWTVLSNYLTINGYGYQGNGDDIAKSLAANRTWNTYANAGTPGNNPFSNNSSGFSGVSAGGRDLNVLFVNLGGDCAWWSSTEASASGAWLRVLAFNFAEMARDHYPKSDGFSLRCVKD